VVARRFDSDDASAATADAKNASKISKRRLETIPNVIALQGALIDIKASSIRLLILCIAFLALLALVVCCKRSK